MPKADPKVTRKRRRRGSIKAEDIVAGAFEVARRISLDQLSMPILAEHLDVGVTSIYWYFRKKDDLLNAMTDVAADKFVRLLPAVRDEDTWQRSLVEHFGAERTIHREDEILSDLLLIRTSTYSRDATRRVMETIEAVLAKLVSAGFTPDNALLVYNAISVYTRGSIITDRILRLAHTPTLDPVRQRRMTDWSTMPVLDGLVDRYPLAGTTDEDFDFGLDRMVCGFEVLLREQDEAPRKSGRRSAPAPAARKSAHGKAAS